MTIDIILSFNSHKMKLIPESVVDPGLKLQIVLPVNVGSGHFVNISFFSLLSIKFSHIYFNHNLKPHFLTSVDKFNMFMLACIFIYSIRSCG